MNPDSTAPTTSAPPRPNLLEFIILACLCLLVCLLVWPGMTSPRVGDDNEILSHVAGFQSWRDSFKPDCYGFFRPLKGLLFYSLNVDGLPSIFKWHAINLAAYLAATLSVHFLIRRLTGSWTWGLVATFLWATSATQASTAIWMTCMNISIAMLFASPAIIFYDRSWSGKAGRSMALCIAFLALSLVSYETAICIAPLCLLVDLFRGRAVFSKPAIFRYLVLGLVTLAYLGIRASLGATHDVHATNGGFDPAMPTWQLTVSAPWLLWRHFSMWLTPFGRLEFNSTYVWGLSAPLWEIAAAWGFVIALFATVVITRKRIPLVSFGLAWFLIASFPTSNLIPIWAGPIQDYYLVFPSVGLALALAGGARALFDRPRLAPASSSFRPTVAAVISILALVAAWRIAVVAQFGYQAHLWATPVKLYLSNADSRPGQFSNKTLAARELLLAGDLETSKQLALEASKEGPWQFVSYFVLAEIGMKEGQDDIALSHLDQCLSRAKKGSFFQFANLRKAEILMKRPERDQIKELLLPILADTKSTYHYDATRMLAGFYLSEGDKDKATRTLEKSLAIHPQRAGELKSAIQAISQAATGEPVPPPEP